jgi:hypothetical protein
MMNVNRQSGIVNGGVAKLEKRLNNQGVKNATEDS